MSLLFCDSFDHYATADITAKWSSTSGTVTVASGGRRSTNCASVSNGTTGKTLAPGDATCVYGCAFIVTVVANNSFLRVYDAGTVQLAFRVKTDGTLDALRNGVTVLGTSTVSLLSNTYYYLEVKTTIGNSGSYEIRVNGVNVLSASGVDTQRPREIGRAHV